MLNQMQQSLSKYKEKEKEQEMELEQEIIGGSTVSPSEAPETVENEVQAVLGTKRNFAYVRALEKGDEMTEEDKKIIEKFQTKQEEELKECKKMKIVEHRLIAIMTKCYISGCVCHSVDRTGGIFKHYSATDISNMEERMKRGAELWKKNPYSSIEVYTDCYCIVTNGKTEVINE